VLSRLKPRPFGSPYFPRNLEALPVFATVLRAMSANLDPDAALMLRVREGDRSAFETLVDKYKQPVVNLVARTINDPTEAEDIAQHVFVQVFKAAHRYEVTAKFSTWLFTIARNLSLNEIRRRSRHPASSLDETFADDDEHPIRQAPDIRTSGPTETLLQGELEAKVEEAIAELPEKQRTALLMCRHEEFSYEEIARVVGCSLSATKSLIHRARETLKQRLKPYLRSGAWHED
jgi:RNA polymerase sigma-70 factor, ECF subfamily